MGIKQICMAGAVAALGVAAVVGPVGTAFADTNGAVVNNAGSKPGTGCVVGGFFGVPDSFDTDATAVVTSSGQGIEVCHFTGLPNVTGSTETVTGFPCAIVATDPNTGRFGFGSTTDSRFSVTPSGNGTLVCKSSTAVIFPTYP